MKLNKFFPILGLSFYIIINSHPIPASPVNWTIRFNGHEQVTAVEGEEVLSQINPMLDSLIVSIVSSLNEVEIGGLWINSRKSNAQIGSPLNFNFRFDTQGYTHFIYRLHDFEADVHFTGVSPLIPNIDVFYHAPLVEISGFIDPDSQKVHDLTLNTPDDTFEISVGGIPYTLPPETEQALRDNVVKAMIGNFANGESNLLVLLSSLSGGQIQAEDLQQILKALGTSGIATQDITLIAEIDNSDGALTIDFNYEQPYRGTLIQLDTPPIRGMMFSSANIKYTKQSLGYSGGDLSHYDDVYDDEEQFFRFLDSLEIKFIRSDINWKTVEPELYPLTNQSIDEYIAAHSQVFDNLEIHFQLANQYLYDFLVSIGDGHSIPRDAVTGKELWIGYGLEPTSQDEVLGYSADNYEFLHRGSYLAALERHIRAVVRRLKDVIDFWQVENELNQADLAVLTNSGSTFRRNGSAWARVDFLDEVMQTMTASIKIEDPNARITHNFHPFRLRKIQDWEQYLDVIGLTYHPNFMTAFPLFSDFSGELVKIAYYLLDGTTKPVWILSSGYPAMRNGGIADWDFSEDFNSNLVDFNTSRQVKWMSDALASTGASETKAFLFRTYQAHDPEAPISTRPNDHAGLIFPDGTLKASHDIIIADLKINGLSVLITGPDSLNKGAQGDFNAQAHGGVAYIQDGLARYAFYRWERKEAGGDWQEIGSGEQQNVISQQGSADFWLRCEVTDFYGNKQLSNEFLVVVDELVEIFSKENIPMQTQLFANYPNPFNAITNIKFSLANAGNVKLELFDMLGHSVQTIFSGNKPAGYHEVTFDASHLSSGVYFYQFVVGDIKQMRKMILMK
jgi:hypothetical protein